MHCFVSLKELSLISRFDCELLDGKGLLLHVELWTQWVLDNTNRMNERGKTLQSSESGLEGLSETVLCWEETGSWVERCDHPCLTIWRVPDWLVIRIIALKYTQDPIYWLIRMHFSTGKGSTQWRRLAQVLYWTIFSLNVQYSWKVKQGLNETHIKCLGEFYMTGNQACIVAILI